MRKLKVSELVLDFDLYPRNNVDAGNVANLVEALAAGCDLPPVVIDRKSKRVIDGFHRVRSYIRHGGADAEVAVVEKDYKSEQAMFLDAMRYNSSHGAKLDRCDRTHCVLIAERLHIPLDQVAGALNMPPDRLGELRNSRVASTSGGLSVPLKRTISPMFAGKTLTKRQVEANTKLSGMNQVFYANQLIELIEAKLIDLKDDKLIQRLRVLHRLLEELLVL